MPLQIKMGEQMLKVSSSMRSHDMWRSDNVDSTVPFVPFGLILCRLLLVGQRRIKTSYSRTLLLWETKLLHRKARCHRWAPVIISQVSQISTLLCEIFAPYIYCSPTYHFHSLTLLPISFYQCGFL